MDADLVELGMRADLERQRRHPGGIVTYCLDEDAATNRMVLELEENAAVALENLPGAPSVTPVCPPGKTAVDYLRLLAGFRLHTGIEHIQVDVQWAGLKLAQVALRFGADDLVNEKPGSPITEEEIRRIIRDAGFIPKKRDREYRSLSIF
jgi:hypothetical protein